MKKLLLLLFVFILSFSLASCNENSSSSSTLQNESSVSNTSTPSSSEVLEDIDIDVFAPNGAPAFSQALMAKDESNLLPSNFNLTATGVDGSTLPAQFTAGTAEFIFAPSNLGAKLYNADKDAAKYVYAANVTFGNLYLATSLDDSDFTLSDLEGQQLTTFGEGTVVDFMLQKVLDDNNITVSSFDFKGSVQEVAPLALKGTADYYLLAEPVVSVVKANLAAQGKTLKTISIQDELKKLNSSAFANGFSQAGVFVNKEFLATNKEAVDTYLAALKISCDACNDSTQISSVASAVSELEYAGTVPQAVLEVAISKCGIKYLSAKESKECFIATYEDNLTAIGGMIPDEGFFAI